jgi:hypothetical protein
MYPYTRLKRWATVHNKAGYDLQHIGYFSPTKLNRLSGIKAYILPFCILIYALELTALPVLCGPAALPESNYRSKANSSCQRKTAGSCSKKMTDSPCNQSSRSGAKNTADCCINNCPLCYVMTIPGISLPVKSFWVVEKAYPHYQSNYLFLYSSTSWKPPDAC